MMQRVVTTFANVLLRLGESPVADGLVFGGTGGGLPRSFSSLRRGDMTGEERVPDDRIPNLGERRGTDFSGGGWGDVDDCTDTVILGTTIPFPQKGHSAT